MGQQQEMGMGRVLLRGMILVLAVVAIVAAMMASTAAPVFAGSDGGSTIFVCTNKDGATVNATASQKKILQAQGFKCTKIG
jgi:hypothetical protein